MQGNEYHDIKGHFTDKANDGGACHHDTEKRLLKKRDEIKKKWANYEDEFGFLPNMTDEKFEEYNKDWDDFNKELEASGWERYANNRFYNENYKAEGENFIRSYNPEEDEEYYDFKRWDAPHDRAFHSVKEAMEGLETYKREAEEERKQEELKKAKEKEMRSTYAKLSDEEKRKGILDVTYDPSVVLSDYKITEGERVGGYVGHSKSKSAMASEESGSMPKSKWTKDKILEYVTNEDDLKPFADDFKKMTLKDLREIALYEDGWHHTGMFYNRTSYYGVNSPMEIANNLKERINLKEGLKKGLGI